MGNGCICLQNICYRYQDIKIDSLSEEQIQNDKEQLEVTNLFHIVKYFNENEKEINTKIDEKILKRLLSHKKAKHFKSYTKKGDSAYELMLKRILEQKNIERKGPKRRKTLRINNNNEILKLIENVIEENKKIEKDYNENIKEIVIDNTKKESLLLNYKDKKKLINRQSVNINKFNIKKIKNNFEETEINNFLLINEIKNINNNSYYISDANYTCKPRKNSPKKQE